VRACMRDAVGVEVAGRVDRRFDAVRDVFERVVASQQGSGAAVAAWCDGAWVVDLWGGAADVAGTVPWRADSIVQPYSVTKPFAAVCALRLVDREALELDAPVQAYWPEFAAPATVRHVLSHQAGIVALDRPAPTGVFYDWDRMCALLAAQDPSWPPGERCGESALFYGHLVGELVRRVDGRSVGEYLRQEVCGPLGLEFFVGLRAAELPRAIDLTGLDEAFDGSTAAGRAELFARAMDNPPGARDPAVVNGARWRAAEIPAINGHGTARGVAGLYTALLEGRLLSAEILREATTTQCRGVDAVFGHEANWGLGFALDGDCFGMGGLGGSYGGACADGGYAFGFVTGAMGDERRGLELENAVRECLGFAALD
jgi:CubicO group peptidase (beta-lactamase class C family)